MTRASLLVALAGALTLGCYQSHQAGGASGTRDGGVRRDSGVMRDSGITPPPIRPDAGIPPPPGDNSFVIAELHIPEPTGAGRAPGANLDGMDSGSGSTSVDATCEEFNQDFRSLTDGTRGVDDAYGGLIGTVEGLTGRPVDDIVREQILNGQLLIVITLPGGGAIDLQLALPTGPLEHDGRRLLPGNRLSPFQPLGRGMVSGGRRQSAQVSSFGAMLPPGIIPGLPIGLLQEAQLRFDATPAGLERGEIGGWVRVEDAVADASILMPGIEDTVRSVLESVSDIRPGPDPAVCEGLSVGMTFTAVPVILVR